MINFCTIGPVLLDMIINSSHFSHHKSQYHQFQYHKLEIISFSGINSVRFQYPFISFVGYYFDLTDATDIIILFKFSFSLSFVSIPQIHSFSLYVLWCTNTIVWQVGDISLCKVDSPSPIRFKCRNSTSQRMKGARRTPIKAEDSMNEWMNEFLQTRTLFIAKLFTTCEF